MIKSKSGTCCNLETFDAIKLELRNIKKTYIFELIKKKLILNKINSHNY